MSMNIVDDVDGPLDPRIQIELENLNNATDDINKLEIELDEANTAYGQLLSQSTSQLKELMNKLGSSCIDRARCYYEACEVAHQARLKCQQQAQLYQRANVVHAAAKETVARAESCFMSHQHEWNFDQAWQDTLNQATLKVTEAENQKAECAREHQRRTVLFHEAERKVQQLEEKYRRSINKAKPYFDLKAECDQKLSIQKEVVDCLKKAVKDAKCSYAKSLRALEEISNQIHEKRRDYDIVVNGPREPGVGAELVTPDESLNYQDELNKVRLSRVNSIASSIDNDDQTQDFEDVKDLKQRLDHLSARSADGSESTSSQWELELQASVEKLNNLPFEPPRESENIITNFGEVESEKSSQIDRFKQFDWQSLAQTPINSFINRSKLALKNSFSSPINMGNFSFGKTKPSDSQTVSDEVAKVKNNLEDKSESCAHSLDSTPVRTKSLKKSSNETPLLSFFQKSTALMPPKDKSCSMIDLNEKKNLKTLLDSSELGNIQAASLEKLANARNKLVGDS